MLLKKLIFLIIPLVLVYMRSRTAQDATRWMFRGVIPQNGPLGKVLTELRESPSGPIDPTPSRPAPRRSSAARLADNWPVFLAFVAGISLAALIFSRGTSQN